MLINIVLLFNFAVILLIVLINMLTKNGRAHCSNIYVLICGLTSILCVTEAISYMHMPLWFPMPLYRVLMVIDYVLADVIIIFFLYYSYSYIRERTEIDRKLYEVPAIMLVMAVIATVYDALNGNVFAIVDRTCIDTTGKNIITSIVEILIIPYIPVVALTKRRVIGIKAICALGLFAFIPLIALLMFLISGGEDYTVVSAALCFFIMYICLENNLSEEFEREHRVKIEAAYATLQKLSDDQKDKIREIEHLNDVLLRQQDELTLTSKRAEMANRAKTRFLFNMSHDIRTPMNAVVGYTELIRQHIDNREKVRDYLDKLQGASGFLLGLINNVLEMSRIESGKATLDEKPCLVKNITHEMQALFHEALEIRHHHLEFVNEADDVRAIYCDPVKVKEIFANILSNAIKYTPDGGIICVRVKRRKTDREGFVGISVSVEDNGIGMSRDYLPQLFEEFEREKSYTDNKIEGTGLGLPIVKKLVDLMGGTISVESELGKGSTFTVDMDLRLADEKLLVEQQADEEVGEASISGKRILMAEDNELNAEIAMEILASAELLVEHAEDGVQCLEMLRKAPQDYYDMVLMDIQMPNMDGYETTRRIRQLSDPAKARIPVIAMTANAFEEDRQNAFEAGMDGHLSKPIDMPVLMAVLRKVLAVVLFLLLPLGLAAQTDDPDDGKGSLWEKFYMPIEMGAAISPRATEGNAYQVNTSVEFRTDRSRGAFFVVEYDEHTHPYTDLSLSATNVVEGDAQYMDVLLGAGWRKPLMKHVAVYALAQAGVTYSTLKNMSLTDGTAYHLTDNDCTIPSGKASLGVEYVFSPSYNLFLKGSYLHHFQPTQLEHDGISRGMFAITLGVNISFF